jgi:hypothetical protein
MPIEIVRNEVPQQVQQEVAQAICVGIGNRPGLWEIDITSELKANAWDVEIFGPGNFYWAQRFSGRERDPEVMTRAIQSAVHARAA